MIIEQRQNEEIQIQILITLVYKLSFRPARLTTTAHDSSPVLRTKSQVNVKKQMINYRASLRTQVFLRAPGHRAGKEEKKN